MELAHSTHDEEPERACSILGIDLNEIPSTSSSGALSPEAFTVVQTFHSNPTRSTSAAAVVPGDACGSACPDCGRPEVRGHVMVCDGCERGFHLGCAGMRARQAAAMDDWLCPKCVSNGVASDRWPLGLKSNVSGHKRCRACFLEINASPPSDGEGERSEDLADLRKHSPSVNSFGVNCCGAYAKYLKSSYEGNAFGLGVARNAIKLSFEDIFNHTDSAARSLKVDMHSLLGSLPSAKRRKCPGLLTANGVAENNKSLDGSCCHLSSEICTTGHVSNYRSNGEVMRGKPEENSGTGPQQFSDGLPIQFEDFFVLSLGKVDSRPSYHCVNQIWPPGYRSCWHDRVTGSIFICDVLDGGDSGPVFKVSRRSCSTFPIPIGSTILSTPNRGQSICEIKKTNEPVACSNMDYDDYCSVQMLLSDASPPKEGDVLSCLSSFSDESLNLQTSDCLQFGASSVHEGFGDVLSDALVFKDEIGEFSVEGLSSSSAWRVVSKKLIDTCRQIYMRRGSLKLLCEHVNKDTPMTFDHMHKKDEDRCTSLAKFFASSSSVKIPSVIQGVVQLETLLEELLKWLDQERFGLDIEFVQEIIEQLPDVHACLEYVLLKKRSCYSSSITVGNGLLVVQTKDGRQARDDDGLVGLTRGLKRARTDMVEDLVIQCPHPPPGKPISSKIPPESIGDFLQVREFLWRFYEVLGLEDPFSIEELEEELISQTLDDCNLLGKSRELQRSLDTSLRLAGSCQRVVSSGNESDSAVIVENSQAFVEIPMRVVNEATQARLESITYGSFMGVALTKVHCSLLKVLIGELQSKVAAIMDSKCDSGESKPKRGRKKDMDVSVSTKETKLHMLPVNELTWPELARRYLLAVLSLDGNFDPQEIAIQGSGKLFRCLQGDGGLLCGSLTGVIGMEADALLLGQAMKKMFGSLSRENDMLTIDEGSSDASNACETITQSEGNIPEWAQLLEPVRKLPTNVGTRIRKCVYNALEKDPPEWAKKILEHSISKEVYKGNASGPTKKAVLSVLANVYGEGNQKKPDKERKKKNYALISDIIMKCCRVVLRRAAAADTGKVFCNMLGRNLISCCDNHDGGILGSPAMVSRPLDFRTIDLRLAVGAYGRFHEAFVDDVRELWTQIRIAHLHRPDLVHLAETLSSIFEDLYEKEVVSLYKKLVGYTKIGCLTAVSKREIDDLLASTEIPKAPWEEGVCKVCGIDKDDGSVLLCDSCDSEYHTYCLSPPLVRIPQGNWYCRFCVANKQNSQGASGCTSAIIMTGKKCHGEVTCADMENLSHLVSALEEKEYWDFSVAERISLIKFLCDELLDSSLIHQHLDHSMELSAELQHKLRSLYLEQRNLMCKDENLAANVAKTERYSSFGNCSGKTAGDNPMTEAVDAGDQFNENVHAVVEGIQLSGNVSSHISNLENNNLNLEENAQGGIKTYAGKVVSTLPFTEDGQGSCPPQEPNSFELNSTRNEASLMQESVGSMEMQLMKLSLRREFLGRDSTGRLYWVLTKLGRHSWVIVSSREMTVQKGETMTTVSGVSSPCMHRLNDVDTIDPAWLSYESDAEINELLECLTDSDPKERALKESILHWLKLQSLDSKETENRGQDESQMFDSKDKENSLLSDSLITKASSLLENKYGPWSVPETMDLTKHGRKVKVTADIKMFRCNCLEPVWPSRHHCLSCHRTFFNELEFGGHDAVCKLCLSNSKKSKGNSDFKGKEMITARRACTSELGILQESENCYDRINSNLIKYQNDGLGCPFGYDEICSKFVTDNSLKKLVQEIGLIGSNGRPSFVPSVSPYLSDSTLKLVHPKGNCGVSREESKTNEQQVLIQGINVTTDPKYMSDSSPGNAENETNARSQSDKPLSGSSSHKDENPSVHNHSPASQVGGCCVIPETALRPLLGKASQILRQLKINLLDMDAALPVGALRPPKAHLQRIWAWRAFVKSAKTIYEMVQAVIVFEDMIKAEYLRNMWWYWSSVSAAAKISTLSSLALRIYSLDAAIDYEKYPSNLDHAKLSGKQDQMSKSGSDAVERLKLGGKLKRRRGGVEV